MRYRWAIHKEWESVTLGWKYSSSDILFARYWPMDLANESVTDKPKQGVRPIVKICVVGLGIALLLPLLLGKTALRDIVLNAMVDSDKLTLRSSTASLGFFSPISVTGLSVESKDKKDKVSFQQISADRSWVGMLFSRPELGNFRFDQPNVDITVVPKSTGGQPQEASKGSRSTAPLLPKLTANIVDATVIVRTTPNQPPPIYLAGINAEVRLERRGSISLLILEPARLFDHQPLTPQLCGQGLQLIAPLLADEVSASGEFSFNLTKCEIPVGSALDAKGKNNSSLQVSGQLDLHSAHVSMKNTVARNVVVMVGQLAGISLPDALTVAQNVTVEFEVVDGRIHHSGLALLLPHGEKSIEIVSSGSVGLDETLDLTLAVKLPEGMLGKGAVREALTREPLQFAVGGTLESPKLKLAGKKGIFQSVGNLIESAGDGAGDNPTGDVGTAITDVLGDILNLAKERTERKRASQDSENSGVESEDPNAGRIPFLPRLRGDDRGRGILPRRGRGGTSPAENPGSGAPAGGSEGGPFPQPPETGPSSRVPTPI
jgi:hypothetical protein